MWTQEGRPGGPSLPAIIMPIFLRIDKGVTSETSLGKILRRRKFKCFARSASTIKDLDGSVETLGKGGVWHFKKNIRSNWVE